MLRAVPVVLEGPGRKIGDLFPDPGAKANTDHNSIELGQKVTLSTGPDHPLKANMLIHALIYDDWSLYALILWHFYAI